MKISLTIYETTISVEVEREDLRLGECIEEIVKPVVCGVYSEALWEEYFGEDER